MAHYFSVSCAIAVSVGVISHLLYFIRGEHHQHTLHFLQILFYGFLPFSFILSQLLQLHHVQAMRLDAALIASYLIGLWLSMLVYRFFFHGLHSFPGPPLARLSKLYEFFSGFRLDGFRRLHAAHQEYGNFVRTGPNELSIISPNVANPVLGAQSHCIRSPWYDYNLYQSIHSLHATRDVAAHDARRRIWDHAFSAKALRDYEGRVTDYTHELMDKISSFSGNTMNASAWFNYWSFDVMGDLTFGKSFNMLKTGRNHFAIDWCGTSLVLLGYASPIPWAAPVGAILPYVGRAFRQFTEWCSEQIDERRDRDIMVPNITSWLLKTAQDKDDAETTKWLHGDSRVLIVAGTETVATTLTHIFYYLAKDPAQVRKVREEIESLMRPDEPFNAQSMVNAKHLNGIINEALRLHPPSPAGGFRTTPPQGITVDDIFIPGGVNICVPLYSLGRSAECFVRPNDFVPERWYSKPELVLNRAAFAPFSLGKYGCIGKELAKLELRTVVTLLVSRFDIRLAPGEDGTALLEKSRETVTMRLEELRVIFEERESESKRKGDRGVGVGARL